MIVWLRLVLALVVPETTVANLGKPQPDWFLRIQAAEGDYVDMSLGPYDDIIHDCLLLAARYVPRFQALLFCPESVVIYEHTSSY
jgi:hypothetical protein